MGYFGTALKRHLIMGLLLSALVIWAMTATILALRAKNETTLIGIDKNGTRIITQAEDPLFKTEVVNFIRRFVSLLYNFDSTTFVDNVGSASDLMALPLWTQQKGKIVTLGETVKKESITHAAVVQKITMKDGKYQVLIETNEMVRMKNAKRLLKLEITLAQVERTARNPWGMEVSKLEESKAE
jgi:hypothetical protein